MKFTAGLLILAACSMQSMANKVCPDDCAADPYYEFGAAAAATASAASNADGGGAAAASAASAASGCEGEEAAAASAAAASSGNEAAAASAAAASSGNEGGGAAAAATATATSSSGPECTVSCNCNRIYDPVCGTDGNTYSNECVLRCISEDNKRNGCPEIGLHHKGQCSCISCYCPAVDQPVCGTNGQTYGNECFLKCVNTAREKDGLYPIKIAYNGACKDPCCKCCDVKIPVCGSDGKTYMNVCLLQCYSRINQAHDQPAIFVKHYGACKNEACDCTLEKNELCASDENTYLNDCLFERENWRRKQLGEPALTIQYRGKCIQCACPRIYKPVCGNNDVTFNNECLLVCENQKRAAAHLPPLFMRWEGHCDCGCPKDCWKPVCTCNHRTFPNRCALGCHNKKRAQDGLPPLTILREGSCQCDCRWCGDKCKAEVCGSDGRTYFNMCWLKCNSDCGVAAGLPALWKCYDGKCKT